MVPLTDRIDYLCPMTNNLCYVLAVEKLLGLEIPARAQWLRVMLNELQRISSSPADAARNVVANGEADVSGLLSQVNVPTLVMHARHDARVPFEMGRRMAAGIPGARLVPLESQNHVILENEPAFVHFLDELKAFIEPKTGR